MHKKVVSSTERTSDIIKKLSNPNGLNIQKYAEKNKLDINELRLIISALKEQGLPIFRTEKVHKLLLPKGKYLSKIESVLSAKTYTRTIASISDLHLNAHTSQTPIMHDLARIFKEHGVTELFIVGDQDEGSLHMHFDAVFNQKNFGLTEKTDYIIKMIPRIPGVKIYWIYGNHDLSIDRDSGYKILDHVSRERPDITTLGANEGRVNLGNTTAPFWVSLSHPSIKPKKAKSANLDEEMMLLPSSEPVHLYLRGHDHEEYMSMVNNTLGKKMPCLKGQDPYTRSLRLRATIGGTIFQISWNRHGWTAIKDTTLIYKEINEQNIAKWEMLHGFM